MIDLMDIVIKGYIEAKFAGYNENGLIIDIDLESYDKNAYFFVLYDSNEGYRRIESHKQTFISYELISQVINENKEWQVCVVFRENNENKGFFLHNSNLKVSSICKDEMYDKRMLFGKTLFFMNNIGVVCSYQTNGLLTLTTGIKKEYVYQKQIKNEIIREELLQNEYEVKKYHIYTKCKCISGSYIGIISKFFLNEKFDLSQCIPYYIYEEKNEYIYMAFEVSEDVWNEKNAFFMVWSCKGQIYFAPLCKRILPQIANISKINYISEKGIEFVVSYDLNNYGNYVKTECIDVEVDNQNRNDFEIYHSEVIYTEQKCQISYIIDTSLHFYKLGSWEIKIYTCKDGIEHILDVIIDESFIIKELYDTNNTKYKLTFKKKNNKFRINRVFGHNALSKKNIQINEFYTISEFLKLEDISPKGKMYGEYLQKNGKITIKLYQQMKDILEAELVMYHSQGMGVLSTQILEITDGKIKEFQVEAPNIDWDNKFLKPINSIWFRVVIAIRTKDGIYLSSLMQYDLETDEERNKCIYDDRKLYFKPIGNQTICGISMEAVPYYAAKKALSMKFVRHGHLYRSQFTNELLDVRIKNDILTIKIRCRDCGGTYKGILMEYRKVKEDDAESYLIPYDSLAKENDNYIMITNIDMKKYYMRMLYWDIRCAFEIDGNLYTVSCHSNNKRFLNKYKGVFVDRTYPNENSIMFPYATANNSVALMHRETCPQDHWNFRLKEKIAEIIYKCFKSIFDKKNIYLIFEKYCTMAQDNGYFFFKYCMEANVEQDFDGEIYYVIDKNTADWKKVVPYHKHVLKYLSLKHMIYLQACKLMISTDTKGHAYVWRSMGSNIKALTYQKKLVFLQHGVTAFKRGHFERGTNVGCESFITTSQFEHDIIHNYLGYPEEEIPITGFARWDVLHDKSEGHREILMMPTWRTWLDDAENEVFAESDYCKNYMALLNDKRLDEILKKYDVTLNFYLHPKFRKFITEFSVVSENIRLIQFGEEPLNELMMECNLLITDFSSVAWDVYYMNKPVLFYHFDIEVESKTLGFYMDMKNDIFGDRAEEPEELMELIIEYIESGFAMKEKYKNDREKYFAYVDDNNSERIWKAIQERAW